MPPFLNDDPAHSFPRTFAVELTAAEAAQLDKLAAFEERDPAALLRAFVLDGLRQRQERRRSIEIKTSGRPKRRKPA